MMSGLMYRNKRLFSWSVLALSPHLTSSFSRNFICISAEQFYVYGVDLILFMKFVNHYELEKSLERLFTLALNYRQSRTAPLS
jgi:hypothetical protein